MTWRAIGLGVLAATALAAAGCGGNEKGGEQAAGGACAVARAELESTVAERDRLFVDLQLGKATEACEAELGTSGSTKTCTAARADLEAASAETTPPPDLGPRVEAAVEACVGTTITSTIPAP